MARIFPNIARANLILRSLAKGSKVSHNCKSGPPDIVQLKTKIHTTRFQVDEGKES